MVEYHLKAYYSLTYYVTISWSIAIIVMLAACLCCKKKVQKNDLLGLEGMVKLKNPDEVVIISVGGVGASSNAVGISESQAELNASTVSNADSEKRSSTAAHRSLPDIPIAETLDNGSELYETVADKMISDAQNANNKNPSPVSLKKQTSVSQHSSISQADDVSSPYSRVKNLPHDYAKVRATEHPYAQLHAPSTSSAAVSALVNVSSNASQNNVHSAVNSTDHNGQLGSDVTQNSNNNANQVEIPAASAIAGMISASQDLPYMTPPIANQHFSGDSQDSSKGYTSISVREPLANILAQQTVKSTQRNPALGRDANDSHYATVSDDSDETYAAIDDPNGRNVLNAADIYTSGSETYAQIQPMQTQPIVVAVEINSSQHSTISANAASQQLNLSNVSGTSNQHRLHGTNTVEHNVPVPPPVDSLRAQMHSRQASSSSNNSSSICNLGSPKPEKRQANSPLPPTPKSNAGQAQHLHATSNSNLTSCRNSVISVIEIGGGGSADLVESTDALESTAQKKHSTKSLSPSKDIEGMYAKVMKKHKFSSRNSNSSQQNSPVMARKQQQDQSLGVSPLDNAAALLMDAQKIVIGDRSRGRSNSYSAKDHGYETIPADGLRSLGQAVAQENRKSDCYANILQQERQHQNSSSASTAAPPPPPTQTEYKTQNTKPPKHYETIASPASTIATAKSAGNDPGYEQLLTKKLVKNEDNNKKSSEYDPNYEVLESTAHSDDGYAKVLEKKCTNNAADIDDTTDATDGYSKIKGEDCSGGYSTISGADANHNYASILETKAETAAANSHNVNVGGELELDHYARISETVESSAVDLSLSNASTPASVNCLPVLPMASPSSNNSSSLFLLNNSSSITSTVTTTSTSTMSSRQTPSSSQYESLTCSETDPNYESVCYLNSSSRDVTETENPYERLHTDPSDEAQLSSSSPMTPDGCGKLNNHKVKEMSPTSANEQVDDYFHV